MREGERRHNRVSRAPLGEGKRERERERERETGERERWIGEARSQLEWGCSIALALACTGCSQRTFILHLNQQWLMLNFMYRAHHCGLPQAPYRERSIISVCVSDRGCAGEWELCLGR
jgi:hypothetical protein